MSKKKAQSLSLVLFFIGLAFLTYYNYWWPGIMLAVGIPLALRYLMLQRYYDMSIAIIVFGGIFVMSLLGISFNILVPALFILLALYIFLKNFLGLKEEKK